MSESRGHHLVAAALFFAQTLTGHLHWDATFDVGGILASKMPMHVLRWGFSGKKKRS